MAGHNHFGGFSKGRVLFPGFLFMCGLSEMLPRWECSPPSILAFVLGSKIPDFPALHLLPSQV